MNDHYPASDFDEWAEFYDQSVINDAFPFGVYTQMIDRIFTLSQPNSAMEILDAGTGTGAIAARFAALGCKVIGLDFSSSMLEKARQKVPGIFFVQADLREDFLPILEPQKFDRIVSGFTFHHFPLEEKISILRKLGRILKPGGLIVIGDISFVDLSTKDIFQNSQGSNWEEEEYWISNESISKMEKSEMIVRYEQINSYTGIYQIRFKKM